MSRDRFDAVIGDLDLGEEEHAVPGRQNILFEKAHNLRYI